MKKKYGWISILVAVSALFFFTFHWRLRDMTSTDSEVAVDNTPESPIVEKFDEVENAEECVIDAEDEDYKEIEDDVGKDPIDIYIAESKRIRKVFGARGKQLLEEAAFKIEGRYVVDFERWEEEYYQPLYEEVKKSMAQVLGMDDFLVLWENLALVQEFSKINISIPYTYEFIPYSSEASFNLLTIYTLAILSEKRDSILKGAIDEVSKINGQDSEKNLNYRLQTIPLRYFTKWTFDNSWYIMAIYSFKSERSRKILYEIATNNLDDRFLNSLASFATFYLPLSYDSNEFIPSLNALLETDFEHFYNRCPEPLRENFDGKEVDSLTNDEFNNILSEFTKENPYFMSDVINSFDYIYLKRVLKLRDSLLFNEKIPLLERERFDVVRRKLAISWALSNKYASYAPRTEVILKKGEGHFVEYLREYYLPGQSSPVYHFEEDE